MRAYLFFAPILCVSTGLSQIPGSRYGPQFPFVAGTARSAALGEAVIAMINPPSGSAENPAMLSFVSESSIHYGFHRIAEEISLQRLDGVVRGNDWEGWGAQIDLLHFGNLDFYSNPDVRQRGFEISVGFSYGRRISRDIGVGVGIRFLSATTDIITVKALAGDIGLSYVPGKYYRFGFSLRGLGTDYDTRKPIIPTDVQSPNLTRSLSIGVAFDYPFALHTQRLLLAFQNDKLLGQSGILYKMGIEYQPVEALAFRCGGLVRQKQVVLRWGFGLKFEGVGLDYAYSFSRKAAHPSHIVTVGVFWK